MPTSARTLAARLRRIFRDETREGLELRAVDAANVTVEAMGVWESAPGQRRTLAEAAIGQEVRVVGISPLCQGPQRRRLLDLGLVPGTRITPELVSTSGDPVAYRIRGAMIALRRGQAEWIEVADAEAAEVSGASVRVAAPGGDAH